MSGNTSRGSYEIPVALFFSIVGATLIYAAYGAPEAAAALNVAEYTTQLAKFLFGWGFAGLGSVFLYTAMSFIGPKEPSGVLKIWYLILITIVWIAILVTFAVTN